MIRFLPEEKKKAATPKRKPLMKTAYDFVFHPTFIFFLFLSSRKKKGTTHVVSYPTQTVPLFLRLCH